MSLNILSIIIPCYNEAGTIANIVDRVLAADVGGMEKEIIIIEDGSTDSSLNQIEKISEAEPNIRFAKHSVNKGKGAALRTGFKMVKGDIVVIQDADLEYDPNEYLKMLTLITSGKADVVYGSRFRGGESVRVLYFWHSLGNKVLTLLSNMLTDLILTDMETCFKMFRKDVLDRIEITENRFGFEPEITAKISHLDPPLAIYEVGISYSGRTYAEGKKIGWKDGVRAFYCILRYNLFR